MTSTLVKSMEGTRFTRLLVVSRAKSDRNGNAMWHCVCDCGNTTISHGFSLRNGAAKSCGCLTTEQLVSRITKHGMAARATRSSEYRTWGDVIQRCRNPNNSKWRLYGGRGIQVCERWLDFENFLEDMGPKPSPKYSIERLDGNRGYEPGNCAWATIEQQNNNTSRNRMVNYKGSRMSLTMAIRVAGSTASHNTIRDRIKRGWSIEDAIDTPPDPRVKNQYS